MKYSHDEIQKMLNPIFEYMKEVHPTNCKLVINALSAELVYEHRDQIWMSETFNKKYDSISKQVQEFAKSPEMQKLKDKLFAGINPSAANKSPMADYCCDMEAAEQQIKDSQILTYEEYMDKWSTSDWRGTEQAIPSWINLSSSGKDCTTTTDLFNKESE